MNVNWKSLKLEVHLLNGGFVKKKGETLEFAVFLNTTETRESNTRNTQKLFPSTEFLKINFYHVFLFVLLNLWDQYKKIQVF